MKEYCKVCGKKYEATTASMGFCSLRCMNIYHSGLIGNEIDLKYNQEAYEFICKLVSGGKIVSSGECTEEEIKEAQRCGRFFVNQEMFGFVYFPPYLNETTDVEKDMKTLNNIEREIDAIEQNKLLSWEEKFDRIFSNEISGKIHKILKLEYYDPNSSYEEDARAFISAFRERMRKINF